MTTILLFCFALNLESTVENSIIPTMEKFECIENLPIHKFSNQQVAEINSALCHRHEAIRLVSYNVLFNICDHQQNIVNRWPQRLPRVVELIGDMHPDILAVQELYTSQLQDILPFMENSFNFYSRQCENGELNGIFYRKDRFELIDGQVFYMTPTPDTPSSHTLTMVKLKDLKTGHAIAVFNVHLTFSRIEKRDFQTQFIADHIEELAAGLPILLTGDFNSFPHRMDLGNLPFYDGDYMHRKLIQGCLRDAKDYSILGHVGPISTFSNEGENPAPFKGTGTPGVMLDHIYISKGIHVIIHAVQSGKVNGHFPSDHFPVLIDFYVEMPIVNKNLHINF